MKISIITVSFNAEDTIRDTIDSVLNQDYKDIEYIIIDGGSTDGTVSIIKEYQERISYWVSEPDEGIYFGMNKGIGRCTGSIVGVLNADDIYSSSDVISNVVLHLTKSKADSLYADLEYVAEKNLNRIIRKWVSGKYDPKSFLKGWMPPHPTFFIKRQFYDDFGVFNTSLKSAADYELMLRMLFKHQISCAYLSECIVKMRVGGESNASVSNRIRANLEDRQAWKMNNLQPKWYTLYLKPLLKLNQFINK